MKNSPKYLSFSRTTRLFLRIALPLLVLSSLTLLIFCLQESHRGIVYLNRFCRPLLEFPVAGLSITAAGTFLIDYIERNS